VEPLDARWLPSGLTPAQVVGAYGLGSINYHVNNQVVRGDGSGQTIAIVTAFHAPNLVADLHTFDQRFGLPDPAVTQVYAPGTPTNDGWASEAMLDVEWVHAIAPGASLVVVEAKSDSLSDMLAAENQARMIPGVSVVSMSWGAPEFPGVGAYDSYFTTPAGHNGITFVASTGDNSGAAGTTWPAVSSNVLAVGGTTLQVDAAGGYRGESAWSGTGGGASAYEAKPSYQLGATPYATRAAADVAAVGDPNTGVAVYVTAPSTGQGRWVTVGGTSLSVPIWAATIAIINQGRALLGLGTLDGPTQTLPAIYASPAYAFHDVAGGSNGYAAGPGYDLPTGRGTPNGPYLVSSLVGWTSVVPTTIAPAVTLPTTTTTTPRYGSPTPRRYYPGSNYARNPYSPFNFFAARRANLVAARAAGAFAHAAPTAVVRGGAMVRIG
jgi:subtilase family serine protease